MKHWGALLLIAIGGCSTGITAPMDMSAAPADFSAFVAGDLAMGCTLAFSGDVTMSVPCRIFLCHPTDGTYEDLDLAGPIDNPTSAHASFDVDGTFAVRSYARADLRTLDVGITVGGTSYRAQASNGTAALTLSAVTEPSGSDLCSGVAHGSATATLVEVDTLDAGAATVGPGRVMLQATF